MYQVNSDVFQKEINHSGLFQKKSLGGGGHRQEPFFPLIANWNRSCPSLPQIEICCYHLLYLFPNRIWTRLPPPAILKYVGPPSPKFNHLVTPPPLIFKYASSLWSPYLFMEQPRYRILWKWTLNFRKCVKHILALALNCKIFLVYLRVYNWKLDLWWPLAANYPYQ